LAGLRARFTLTPIGRVDLAARKYSYFYSVRRKVIELITKKYNFLNIKLKYSLLNYVPFNSRRAKK